MNLRSVRDSRFARSDQAVEQMESHLSSLWVSHERNNADRTYESDTSEVPEPIRRKRGEEVSTSLSFGKVATIGAMGLVITGVLVLLLLSRGLPKDDPTLKATNAYRPTAGATSQTQVKKSTPPRHTVRVWVNTKSHIYYCPGTRWYGATRTGEYMQEEEAERKNRPAFGRTCS